MNLFQKAAAFVAGKAGGAAGGAVVNAGLERALENVRRVKMHP